MLSFAKIAAFVVIVSLAGAGSAYANGSQNAYGTSHNDYRGAPPVYGPTHNNYHGTVDVLSASAIYSNQSTKNPASANTHVAQSGVPY